MVVTYNTFSSERSVCESLNLLLERYRLFRQGYRVIEQGCRNKKYGNSSDD